MVANTSILELPVIDAPADGTVVVHDVGGVARRFAQPITLTPFASARACSARCSFCSETLVHRDAGRPSASLRPTERYHHELASCLEELRQLPKGLSLSGLEATDDLDWLLETLGVVRRFAWTSKVLYSNGNGLCGPRGKELVASLRATELTRIELSRHAPGDQNEAIMRFRTGAHSASSEAWISMVRGLVDQVPLRLVCILQEGGVASADDAFRMLDWARDLGFTDVVFRELSRLGELYVPNRTWRYIESHRVPLQAVLDPMLCGAGGIAWEGVVRGYYYWNVRGRWRDVDVTFETSDYPTMKAHHAGPVVRKLVFHANGVLCADWNPEAPALWRAA